MVSIESADKLTRGEPVSFYGLSTDEKPTTYMGIKITNGSTFFEMDSSKVSFFDADHEQWIG